MYLIDMTTFTIMKKLQTEDEVNTFEFYEDKIFACQGKGYIYLYNNDLTNPNGTEVFSKCELGKINHCMLENNDDGDDLIILASGVQVYKILSDQQ